VKLIEVLAELSRDAKLVISSHSNYIFNKLNNMVLDGKIDAGLYAPIMIEPEGGGGAARLLAVTELGVEDENFCDVTDKLWLEREDIIERRNKGSSR
jgi:predicted ATPase